MCLSIPGRIVEIQKRGTLTMGRLDFGGIVKEACLDYVPEARVGDYVLVHVGFAISVLDADDALSRLDEIRSIAGLSEPREG